MKEEPQGRYRQRLRLHRAPRTPRKLLHTRRRLRDLQRVAARHGHYEHLRLGLAENAVNFGTATSFFEAIRRAKSASYNKPVFPGHL